MWLECFIGNLKMKMKNEKKLTNKNVMDLWLKLLC
jgi:hypothetical protein